MLSKQNKSNNSKSFVFASSALFRLFFISNSAAFVGRGATIFFAPGSGYTSYWREQRVGKIWANLKFFWHSFWQFRSNYQVKIFFLPLEKLWISPSLGTKWPKYIRANEIIFGNFLFTLQNILSSMVIFLRFATVSSNLKQNKATFKNAPTLLIF